MYFRIFNAYIDYITLKRIVQLAAFFFKQSTFSSSKSQLKIYSNILIGYRSDRSFSGP